MDPHEQAGRSQSRPKSQPPENYAKCLSHELRTPMHGIVGLLDLMYATVNEASIKTAGPNTNGVFQSLKRDIEAVQESSRRAIDAADNLVQAVELSLSIPSISPSTPQTPQDEFSTEGAELWAKRLKRRSSETDYEPSAPLRKFRIIRPAVVAHKRLGALPAIIPATNITDNSATEAQPEVIVEDDLAPSEEQWQHNCNTDIGLGMSFTNISDCVKEVVNDLIKREAKPDSIDVRDFERGQLIQAHVRAANAEIKTKTVTWDVDSLVPDSIKVEHRDLAKILACILQNSFKFTDEGSIAVKVTCSLKERRLIVNIKDTGRGISPEFRSRLFRAFSQEDSSITRHKEGLGLGLLVAKGLAKKLRGDLTLISADTEGPNRGTEFSLNIPFSLSSKSHCSSNSGSQFVSPRLEPAVPRFPAPEDSTTSTTPPAFKSPALSDVLFPTPLTPPDPTYRTGESTPAISPHDDSHPPYDSWSNPQAPTTAPFHATQTTQEEPFHSHPSFDTNFAASHPLTFMVVEDNTISRRLLVNMLKKLGYDANTQIREACDGLEAVQLVQASVSGIVRGRRCSSAPPACAGLETPDIRSVMEQQDTAAAATSSPAGTGGGGTSTPRSRPVDVILMDLWMPNLDGYEASKQILQVFKDVSAQVAGEGSSFAPPLILAVTADATQAAVEKAASAGMEGVVLKPFRVKDLEKVVKENIARRQMGRWFA